MVAEASGPARQAPVANLQAAGVGAADLGADEAELLSGEAVAPDEADGLSEGDGGIVAVAVVVLVGVGRGGAGVALTCVFGTAEGRGGVDRWCKDWICVIFGFAVTVRVAVQLRSLCVKGLAEVG